MRTCRAVLLGCFLAAAACASNSVPHTAPDESQPHISWEIRADRGATVVCSSAQPEKRCVLTRSTDQRRSTVGVHILLHSVPAETRYLGIARAPFMSGGTLPGVGEINVTVPPKGRPVNAATSSGVTSQPGDYTLSILLDATQDGQPPTRIVEEVPVLVK